MVLTVAGSDARVLDHLLAALRAKRIENQAMSSVLMGNLIYYLPKVRDQTQLDILVAALLGSDFCNGMPTFDIKNMILAIFLNKLEVSEPMIPVAQFYKIWDLNFQGLSKWHPTHLAVLCGILSTQKRFEELQRRFFIDSDGKVMNLYDTWRNKLFLPLWIQFYHQYSASNGQDSIALLYCAVSDESDTGLPWTELTTSLTRLISLYVNKNHQLAGLTNSNINQVAKTLQLSISKCELTQLTLTLDTFTRMCHNLSSKVRASQTGLDNDNKYYTNILLTVVLSFKGILECGGNASWYFQIIMCLYYLHFITLDFGTSGFSSYTYVYQRSIMGVIMENSSSYLQLVELMKDNIWTQSNNVDDAKIVFLMEFLENTIPHCHKLDNHFARTTLDPLIEKYIDAPNSQIRESVHSMLLTILSSTENKRMIDWESNLLQRYFKLSINQYLDGKISQHQLISIVKAITFKAKMVSYLQSSRFFSQIHWLLKQSLPIEKQITLLKVSYTLLHIAEDCEIEQWLVASLQKTMGMKDIDQEKRYELLKSFWSSIVQLRSQKALAWWYDNAPAQSSKF